MTITYLQPDGVAITAQQFRQGQAATHGGGSGRQLGGRSGFRVGTSSTVLTASSTTWTLGACSAMIDPGASTHQGMYGWSTDANVTGSVTAADATNPRKDIVYILVNDSSAGDGSGALTANVLYLAGTPGVTPAAPTLPARSFLVGTITVPQTGGGSPTVVLNPARYVAAGGILPVADTTEQAGLTKYSGLTTSRAGILEVTDGTNWSRPGPKVIPSAASQVGSALAATAFTTGVSTPIIVPGTKVVTTGTGGDTGIFSIDYPAAFPNGILMVMFSNGDSAQGSDLIFSTAGSPYTQTLATGFGKVVNSAGTALSGTTVRVNYIAVGW